MRKRRGRRPGSIEWWFWKGRVELRGVSVRAQRMNMYLSVSAAIY